LHKTAGHVAVAVAVQVNDHVAVNVDVNGY
jgi:hypothetical protein